jgi:hypothetical protein
MSPLTQESDGTGGSVQSPDESMQHPLRRRAFSGNGAASSASHGSGGLRRTGSGGHAGGGGGSQKRKLLDPAALEGYKAELREFRALQAELAPWTAAFQAQHGCKPALKDVEATGAELFVQVVCCFVGSYGGVRGTCGVAHFLSAWSFSACRDGHSGMTA